MRHFFRQSHLAWQLELPVIDAMEEVTSLTFVDMMKLQNGDKVSSKRFSDFHRHRTARPPSDGKARGHGKVLDRTRALEVYRSYVFGATQIKIEALESDTARFSQRSS